MKITNITSFFPSWNERNVYAIGKIKILLPKSETSTIDDLSNITNFWQQRKLDWARFLNGGIPVGDSGLDYQEYFQFPNPKIQLLADNIVDHSDSDDVKAYKIEQWVINHIQYVSDVKNYGKDEYWALPTETVGRKSGDCEDGAFLIGSLLFHAGVNPDKVFFYGGKVKTGKGMELAGHGWIGYKRNDGEIIPLDWCYYSTDESIKERTPLKDTPDYQDDMFIVTLRRTVETPYANYIRHPENLRGRKMDIYC